MKYLTAGIEIVSEILFATKDGSITAAQITQIVTDALTALNITVIKL
jgi:hypothetical protein